MASAVRFEAHKPDTFPLPLDNDRYVLVATLPR